MQTLENVNILANEIGLQEQERSVSNIYIASSIYALFGIWQTTFR